MREEIEKGRRVGSGILGGTARAGFSHGFSHRDFPEPPLIIRTVDRKWRVTWRRRLTREWELDSAYLYVSVMFLLCGVFFRARALSEGGWRLVF